MATKSIYHRQNLMGTFTGEKFYTKNQDLKKSDVVYVISSKRQKGSLVPFLEGCFRITNSVKKQFKFESKIYEYEATLSALVRPDEPIDLSAMQAEKGKFQFSSHFMNVVKPNLEQKEIDAFDRILSGVSSNVSSAISVAEHLYKDLDDLLQSDTETLQLVLARIGQGKFRKNVAEVWGGKKEVCALTGIALPAILTASHVIPWRECTGDKAFLRLDGANGILLCSHIDRLFDRHLLSFIKKGNDARIVFSKVLSVNALKQLGITDDLELVPNMMSASNKERFFKCMEQHYEKFTVMEAER